jgi:hypothetical protein
VTAGAPIDSTAPHAPSASDRAGTTVTASESGQESSPGYRVAMQVVEVVDAEECVQDAGVADVELGRADEPLGQVGAKGCEPADEEGTNQDVDIGGDGRHADAEPARRPR